MKFDFRLSSAVFFIWVGLAGGGILATTPNSNTHAATVPVQQAQATSTTRPAKVSTPKVSSLASEKFEQNEFRLLSWNVESEGASSRVISRQLKELNQDDKYDVVALSEVLPQDFKHFRQAMGNHYKYAYSKSGHNDRLQILYNEDKFELVRKFEIRKINLRDRYRAPLVVHLRAKSTGAEFMVMVNHLARGKAKIRQKQASLLVEWARDQKLPVFALGDYNFDYEFKTKKGNPAFANMLRDGIWEWVEPEELIDTNWYDDPLAPDGKDDYPGSMLDFAFVAGPAKDWKSTCRILVWEGDFPDDEKTSDHRPFELLISK